MSVTVSKRQEWGRKAEMIVCPGGAGPLFFSGLTEYHCRTSRLQKLITVRRSSCSQPSLCRDFNQREDQGSLCVDQLQVLYTCRPVVDRVRPSPF